MRLTDHGEVHRVPDRGRRGNLALVSARVPLLGRLDLQHPVLGSGVVRGGEPLVRGVGQGANREQVNVPVPHPRDL